MKTYRIILGFCGLFIASPLSAIAQPTGSAAGMSDAERAFVEKQNARKEELRKRYFSPEAKARLQAEMAEKNSRAAVTPGTSTKADPSIAKAKAAGVDTRVFGVPLGEPLSLPRCATANERKNPRQEIDLVSALFEQTATTCQQSEGAFTDMLLGSKPADRYIILAKDSCPNWTYCEVAALLHEGNLVSVMMVLKKVKGDNVGKQLRAKYGKPTRKETANYQNEYGARYEAEELEWVLPGLHIAFAPDPTPNPINGGLVIIETETGRKVREAKAAAQEGKQPKL